MQGLRPPIFKLAAKYGVSVRTIECDLEGDALRPESVKGQEFRNPDGYNLLGQGLRAGSKPEYEKSRKSLRQHIENKDRDSKRPLYIIYYKSINSSTIDKR